jgi:hypothetical protein
VHRYTICDERKKITTSPEPTDPRLAVMEKVMGSLERAAGEHKNLGEGVHRCRRRTRWRRRLEGKPGKVEDRRRSSEEGGDI